MVMFGSNGRRLAGVVLAIGCVAFFASCTSKPEEPVRTWSEPQLIETGDAETADSPEIAFDGAGNAIAVWRQNSIWSNRYTQGSGWGAAEVIETETVGFAQSPQIAFDGAGNAIAVWTRFDGIRSNVWANRYTPSGGWGSAQLIESGAGDVLEPLVAFDASGNAMAVWRQGDGALKSIWANRYVVGTGWGTAQAIEVSGAGQSTSQKLTVDAAGNAIVVWWQSVGGSGWANHYTPSGGWGTAASIADWYCPYGIAFDGAGTATVVGCDWDGSTCDFVAIRYVAESGWGTKQSIETAEGDARGSSVAYDGAGNAHAAWLQWNGTHYDVWANRYDAVTGWGEAEPVETFGGEGAKEGWVRLAVGEAGTAYAVWLQTDGTHYVVASNRYTAGHGWGAATYVGTDASSDASSPQVAVDHAGDATVVWSQLDAEQVSIWTARSK